MGASTRTLHLVVAVLGFVAISAGWLALAGATALIEPLAAAARNWGYWVGDPLSTALWTPVVAIVWSLSFLRRSPTTFGGFRARTPLPLWLLAPWVAFVLGDVAWLGALAYYVPMAAGFATEMLLEARRDDARALAMPGARWTEQAGTITVVLPGGAEIKRRLDVEPKTTVLVRGDEGLEIELGVGLRAATVLGRRLDVALPASELGAWTAEPVTLTVRVA